jgi:hypothetical protein
VTFAAWAERAYETAIGALGMTVDEFEHLTPREFQWRLDAANDRERRALERTAQLAAWVMNPWLKKPITAYDLLGVPPAERPTDWTAWATAK